MKKRYGAEFYIGLSIAVIIIAVSLTSLFYTPYSVTEPGLEKFQKPGLQHLLGTDHLGRDVFSRVMVGGRYSLLVALLTVLGGAAIGTAVGLAAGYFGGIFGETVMRVMDALSAFPGVLLAVVAVAVLDSRKYTIVIALIVLFVPSYTRIMRSGAMQYRDADFVNSLRLLGASKKRIIFIHILPNLLAQLLSATVIGLSNAILAESSMSYLGFGIQPPIPSWGRMLAESQSYLWGAVWLALAPGIAIMLTVISFHYIGEGIRRRLGR
ncbi:MAG: ABC transporter permease [Oscillospiraceae bacterium]|jgi:peptide/nickel transport system permease protein|nr:ABC transporter permease [Oscillospiraceae bacterium]